MLPRDSFSVWLVLEDRRAKFRYIRLNRIALRGDRLGTAPFARMFYHIRVIRRPELQLAVAGHSISLGKDQTHPRQPLQPGGSFQTNSAPLSISPCQAEMRRA